jgi:hypothetical protein
MTREYLINGDFISGFKLQFIINIRFLARNRIFANTGIAFEAVFVGHKRFACAKHRLSGLGDDNEQSLLFQINIRFLARNRIFADTGIAFEAVFVGHQRFACAKHRLSGLRDDNEQSLLFQINIRFL